MIYLFFTFLFLFGIAIGSFLNVVILRYRPGGRLFSLKNLSGRSKCPHCGKTLGALELIPIMSFFLLGGKCRSCRAPIAWQYPVVEFLSGAVVAGVPLFLAFFYHVSAAQLVMFALPRWYYWLFLAWIGVFLSWLTLSVIDFKHFILPDELNIGLFALGGVITGIAAAHAHDLFPFTESFMRNYAIVFSPFQGAIANHVLGFLAGGAFFFLLFLVSAGLGMGFGDVKLAAVAGLVVGWPDIALALILSFLAGGVWGAFLLLLKKKGMKDRLPFGPFLVLGFLLAIFFGHAIVAGYFSMFGL